MFLKIKDGRYVNIKQVSGIDLVSLNVGGDSKFTWVFYAGSETFFSENFSTIEEAQNWFEFIVEPSISECKKV